MSTRNFNYYEWDKDYVSKNTIVEYVWIDGSGKGIRGKTKVYPN
jgi:glutamine synthetase